MELIIKNGLKILKAKYGYKIVNIEKTKVFDDVIYLGKFDSQYNYTSLTIDEANKLQEELNKKEQEKLEER